MKVSEHVDLLEVQAEDKRYYPVIVHDRENTVLVDTGFPLQFEYLEAAIEKAGFHVEAITALLFTHQDIDHIGCAKEIMSRAEAAKTMAHALEAPYIDGTLTPVKLEALDRGNPFYDQFKAGFDNRRIHIDKRLADGEVLPVCGGVEVIHTPGHTPGHICLYVRQDKVLICGDALNMQDGALAGANPIHTQNMEQARQSVQKLARFEIDTFLTYHGGLYRGSAEDIRRL